MKAMGLAAAVLLACGVWSSAGERAFSSGSFADRLREEFPALHEKWQRLKALEYNQDATGVRPLANFSYGQSLGPEARQALESLAARPWGGPVLPSDYGSSHVVRFGEAALEVRPLSANSVAARVEDGLVLYPGAYAETSVFYLATTSEVEELYYLKSAAAPKRFVQALEAKAGIESFRVAPDGSLEALDEAGNRVLRLSRPQVFDSVGNQAAGRFEVRQEGRKTLLAVAFDDSDLRYPLLIDPTWTATAAMAEARRWHTATLLPNGKVLVGGGSNVNSSAYWTHSELYDPLTGTWSPVGSASPRFNHIAVLLPSGKVLLAGGEGVTYSADLYDPASNTYVPTGNMKQGRWAHTGTLLPNGKVLVAGGYLFGVIAAAELYDPATGAWSPTGSMSAGREYHTATLLPNGKVLVTGGDDGSNALSSAEIYDPAAGIWSPASSMSLARTAHTATLLPDGKVLAAGSGNTAEVYDPSAGTWSPTGLMAYARQYHTANLLPNGKVLVTGTNAPAELFDYLSGTWSPAGAMSTTRWMHTATLLPNGNVLVAGGRVDPNTRSELASAELFQYPLLFNDSFSVPDGLITNEYAHWNPTAPDAVKSPDWDMTSGSLFAGGRRGWTGVPDNVTPNATSSNGNNSAVFALLTKRTDFGDVNVSFSLFNIGFTTTSTTPAQPWDAISVLERYAGGSSFYRFEVNRRDNTASIKKRTSAGETKLATAVYAPIFASTQAVSAAVHNNPDGSVYLVLRVNGGVLASATDAVSPYSSPGAVGIRAGNDQFKIGDFAVTSTTGSISVPNPVPSIASLSPSSATAGGPGFTLTVNGNGFMNGSVVQWNGSDPPTTFVSSTVLTAAIPGGDIASPGTASVTVFNPGPGGGTSNSAAFTVAAPSSSCVTSAGNWRNLSFSTQSGVFEAQFDATPGTANMDGVAGLAASAASAYTDLASVIRFNNTGTIDARNGGAYAADAAIPYSAQTAYRFRLAVNVPAHTYSAYVRSGSAAEQLLANNYAFRTEQSSVSALGDLGVFASTGSELICNLAISTPPAPLPTLTAISVLPSSAAVAVGAQQLFTAVGTFSDASTQTLSPGKWSRLSAMPTARDSLQAASVGGVLYAIGGAVTAGSDFAASPVVEAYNPAADAWSPAAPLNARNFGSGDTGRYQGSAVAAGGKVYMMGGWTKNPALPSSDVSIYDPPSNQWSPGPSLPSATGQNGVSSSYSAGSEAASGGGRIFLANIFNGYSGYANNLRIFTSSTNAWAVGPNPPHAHGSGAGAYLNGRFYVAGGFDTSGQPVADVDAYDAGLNQWSTVARLPVPLELMAGDVIGGKWYVVGGNDGKGAVKTVYIYDPAADQWTQGPPALTARSGAAAAAIGGKLYVVGGNGSPGTMNFLNTLEVFDPSASGVAWSSDAPSVAIVSSSGVATGQSAGLAHIIASSGSIAGSAALTINASSEAVLFGDSFNQPDGLVTNQYAYYNPSDPSSVQSTNWRVAAGSLFASGQQGWTGVPDDAAPNAASSNGTGSAFFELATNRSDFGDVAISMSLMNQGLTTTTSTPAQSADGVRILARYQDGNNFYFFDVNRRDDTARVRKKSSGSSSTLASTAYTVPYNSAQNVRAAVKNNADGSVSLSLSVNGVSLLSVADAGPGSLAAPGRVGLRGGNDNFKFSPFTVTSLGGSASAASARPQSSAPTDLSRARVFPNPWRSDIHRGAKITFDTLPQSTSIKIFTITGKSVAAFSAPGGSASWDMTNSAGQPVASGYYVYLLTDGENHRIFGKVAVVR